MNIGARTGPSTRTALACGPVHPLAGPALPLPLVLLLPDAPNSGSRGSSTWSNTTRMITKIDHDSRSREYPGREACGPLWLTAAYYFIRSRAFTHHATARWLITWNLNWASWSIGNGGPEAVACGRGLGGKVGLEFTVEFIRGVSSLAAVALGTEPMGPRSG